MVVVSVPDIWNRLNQLTSSKVTSCSLSLKEKISMKNEYPNAIKLKQGTSRKHFSEESWSCWKSGPCVRVTGVLRLSQDTAGRCACARWGQERVEWGGWGALNARGLGTGRGHQDTALPAQAGSCLHHTLHYGGWRNQLIASIPSNRHELMNSARKIDVFIA